jgi:hypothetical protein
VKIKQWIRDYLAGRAYEKVEGAIKRQARETAEAEYHRAMADWYTKQVDGIDPHLNWNEFAVVKQKEHDHLLEFHAYRQRADEAEQAANARMASA